MNPSLDGIVYYETDKYETDMLEVLRCLLHLARDNSLSPAVKLLITSPLATEQVQVEFGDDDSTFLSTAGLPQTNQEFSMEGFESRLEGSDVEDE